jgi:tetratricopeptide (TPR) repeat protein
MARPSSWHGVRRGIGGLLGVLAAAAFASTAVAAGVPARSYALARAPLEVYDRLPELRVGPVPRLGDEERALLATAWERKSRAALPLLADREIDDRLLLDAMLFASGIEDATAREGYRRRLEALVAGARDALAGAHDDRTRGEGLMAFLHRGVMKGGYNEHQTTLTGVIDTGTFNCVASTAIYDLVGRRLGLHLVPISIPGDGFRAGHASLDLIASGRIQVEPTNRDGFDWQAKVHRPGVVILGYVPDRKAGHEVDALGIAAMIYSNRGVALLKGEPPARLAAARCFLAALALDPADEAATNNLLSVFTNWGPQLAGLKKFEEALRVLEFGLTIAPESRPLRNNRDVVRGESIEAALESGDDRRALTIIRRDAGEGEGHPDGRSPGSWYIRHGEKHLKDGWEAGLAVADRGLRRLAAAEAKELIAWRSGLFRRWSQSLLEKGDVEGSLKVLARAYALDPKDKDVIAGIAYHAQEALRILEDRSGPAGLIAHYRALQTSFPAVDELAEVGRSHAGRSIERLTDAGKFAEAVAAAGRYAPLLKAARQRAELGEVVYDRWARSLAARDPEAALAKYVEGLRAYPGQGLLENNSLAFIDQWARRSLDAGRMDESTRVYKLGLASFPGNHHLQGNLRYCEGKRAKKR